MYTPIKQGILYKQSDHLKIWKSRYFALNEHFLHYYLAKEDSIPRVSLQMVRGIKITSIPEPKNINGVLLYQFILSHPDASTEYLLATTLEDRDSWIETINRISNGETLETEKNSTNNIEDIPDDTDHIVVTPVDIVEISTVVAEDSNDPSAPVHRELVDFNVPITLKAKIDSIVAKILEYSSPEFTRDWTLMYEKEGVKATRRPGPGIICVRGESLLPYNPVEIFELSLNPSMKTIVDPNIDIYERGKWLNFHTGHEYLRSKGSWPTSPRDFSNGTHWRLLNDGRFLNFAFGESHPDFPEQPGVVRAFCYFGAFVMKSVVGGTQMYFLLQVDIGGSVPLAIANFVAQSKPLILSTLRKLLDERYKGKSRPDFSKPIPPVYDGMYQRILIEIEIYF